MRAESSRTSALAAALALFAWAVALRAPFVHGLALDMDEALYVLVAKAWLAGGLPYRDVWDLKPPGLFAIVAASISVFGETPFAARLPSILAVGATSLLLHRLLRRHLGTPGVAFAAAACYAPYTLVMGSLTTKAELMALPFVTGAMLLVDPGRPPRAWRIICAGVLAGCAFTIKQSFAFEAVAVGLLMLGATWRTGGMRAAMAGSAALGAGFLAAPLAFLAAFAARNGADVLVSSALLGALNRSEAYPALMEGLVPFLANVMPMMPLLIVPAVAWLERRRMTHEGDKALLAIGGIWFAAAIVSVALQRGLYTHYQLVLQPPAIVLLGPLLLAAWRARRGFAASLLTAVLAFPLAWFTVRVGYEVLPSAIGPRIAAYLRAQGLGPGERIFVADAEASAYLFADTAPPTRFPMPMHLLCRFNLPVDADAELRRVIASRPAFVLFRFGTYIGCVRPERIAALAAAMGTDYRRALVLADGFDGVDIYCRADRCPPLASTAADPDARPTPPARRSPTWWLTPRADGGMTQPAGEAPR